MAGTYPSLKPLTEQLMKEVRDYGIRKVSTEQYQNVCNSIIRFAKSSQAGSYSSELMDAYKVLPQISVFILHNYFYVVRYNQIYLLGGAYADGNKIGVTRILSNRIGNRKYLSN